MINNISRAIPVKPVSGDAGKVLKANATGTGLEYGTISGSIVQTVYTELRSSQYINSSSGWRQIPSFSVAITPTSSNSKILISTTIHYGAVHDGRWWGARLYRNNSHLSSADNTSTNTYRRCFMSHNWAMASGSFFQYTTANVSSTFLDSPSSTSSQTYSLRINAKTGDTTDTTIFCINRPYSMTDNYRPETRSYIMAQEIYYP